MDPRFSNYPRAGVAAHGPGQRPPGAHFDFIAEGFNIIRADLGTWVAAVLLQTLAITAVLIPLYAVLIGATIAGGSNPGAALQIVSTGGVIVLYAVTLTISLMTYLGMGLMAMQAGRGERPQVGEMFAPFRRFIPVFLTCLVVSFIVLLGAAFFLLPGIIAFGLFALAPFAAYEQDLGPGDALRWSLENSRPHMWSIFGLAFVAYVIAQIGVYLCCVGYLFTGALPGIVLGLTYMTFRNPAPGPFMPYPPSGPVPPFEPPSGPAV